MQPREVVPAVPNFPCRQVLPGFSSAGASILLKLLHGKFTKGGSRVCRKPRTRCSSLTTAWERGRNGAGQPSGQRGRALLSCWGAGGQGALSLTLCSTPALHAGTEGPRPFLFWTRWFLS